MADVNDIADIVRIMGEQPEWADTLRATLLRNYLKTPNPVILSLDWRGLR